MRAGRAGARLAWAGVDALIWVLAVYAAVWLRYDFKLPLLFVAGTAWFALAAAVLHLAVGFAWGAYTVRHRRGSFEEASDLARTVGTVMVPLFVGPLLVYPPPVPRSTAISAGALAFLAMLAVRFLVRARTSRTARLRVRGRRALVFGAGEAGGRLVRGLLSDAASTITPVGFIDDDPAKARLRIEGVRVCGTRAQLQDVADRTEADVLVLAAPTADAAVVRELSDDAAAAGLEVLVAPSMDELIGGATTSADLRDLDFADLLGRTPVQLDQEAIAEHIAGRRVLVTGAGGSIGSELCRQISRFRPERLYLLDRDESGLHGTQMTLAGHGLLDGDDVILADIRDARRMREVMADTRPDLVFHAAALKHLPLLEQYPAEAWKTNVLGTRNVLAAAAAAGVGTVVNISTDKAADPTSVLGLSKRLGEMLTAHYALTQAGRYVSVRFGNVLGSRGSVIHAFTGQIRRGGPVTVTHPDVKRYFMLIPEACQLVLQASAIGADGEVMVLEMGEQVRILDVARTLITMSGRTDIEVVFTGLRPGEKLEEELFSGIEVRRRTGHALVDAVDVPPLDPAHLPDLGPRPGPEVTAWLRTAITTQRPTRPIVP